MEKNGGGGQNWREGKRGKFCARRSEKGGDKLRSGRHKFTMRIIIKGTRNILTRLAHLNYFFGFILADFTLLTKNSKKKMFTYFYVFLNKRVHILYKMPIRSV